MLSLSTSSDFDFSVEEDFSVDGGSDLASDSEMEPAGGPEEAARAVVEAAQTAAKAEVMVDYKKSYATAHPGALPA